MYVHPFKTFRIPNPCSEPRKSRKGDLPNPCASSSPLVMPVSHESVRMKLITSLIINLLLAVSCWHFVSGKRFDRKGSTNSKVALNRLLILPTAIISLCALPSLFQTPRHFWSLHLDFWYANSATLIAQYYRFVFKSSLHPLHSLSFISPSCLLLCQFKSLNHLLSLLISRASPATPNAKDHSYWKPYSANQTIHSYTDCDGNGRKLLIFQWLGRNLFVFFGSVSSKCQQFTCHRMEFISVSFSTPTQLRFASSCGYPYPLYCLLLADFSCT